jgi:hypothetical protein
MAGHEQARNKGAWHHVPSQSSRVLTALVSSLSARRGMDMSAASRSTQCLFLIARQPKLSRNDQYREYGCDP